MPCPDDAKNWQPNALVQGLIDRLANLTVVSERCAAHLRSFDSPTLNQLWATVQAEFRADPVSYPSIMADKNDIEGRKLFQAKYERICFSPEPPESPKDFVRMFFAAHTAYHSIMGQDLFEHPNTGEITSRANIKALNELGLPAPDPAVEAVSHPDTRHLDLIFEQVKYNEKDYTVIDCFTSAVSGDNFLVLQDEEGETKQVPVREFIHTE